MSLLTGANLQMCSYELEFKRIQATKTDILYFSGLPLQDLSLHISFSQTYPASCDD